MSKIKELYNTLMSGSGFILKQRDTIKDCERRHYSLNPENGSGDYRVYFYKDMFEITIRDFVFNNDFFLECPDPENLMVEYYTSVSGEELHPYQQLAPNSLRVHIGGKENIYQAIYHKHIPIRSTGITFMPDFYQRHLQDKFHGEYIDPSKAFKKISFGADFPELVTIFKQIQNFISTNEMTEKLFYEGKSLEVIALIMEKARINHTQKMYTHLTAQDEENLDAAAKYIDNHYSFHIPIEHLCKISFMGSTKLKKSFKEIYGCTISDYLIKKRIGQAQHLLIGSSLSIAEIAVAVGYKRPDSFAKQFQKTTGILPRDLRKMYSAKTR